MFNYMDVIFIAAALVAVEANKNQHNAECEKNRTRIKDDEDRKSMKKENKKKGL